MVEILEAIALILLMETCRAGKHTQRDLTGSLRFLKGNIILYHYVGEIKRERDAGKGVKEKKGICDRGGWEKFQWKEIRIRWKQKHRNTSTFTRRNSREILKHYNYNKEEILSTVAEHFADLPFIFLTANARVTRCNSSFFLVGYCKEAWIIRI